MIVGNPKRIQRSRAKGWHMPEGAVYVGRPSRWGNPWRPAPAFDHAKFAWPLTAVERFEPPLPVRGAQGFWNWNG